MPAIRVSITMWVDDYQPGIVQCVLRDAHKSEFSFIEKRPIVSSTPLSRESAYPQPGLIDCEVLRRWRDAVGREIVTVSTEEPWGVEATTGESIFDVLPEQLAWDDGER